ncbi:hypothetical protein [Leifsonia sp. PS1209]|uniref:hypothetical protein n=1 Tax=Leifsonia sp. PS1209 TaxID=2724914 RepID=UPI001442A460|nr:hypothetical protein [Leifsonia sp. PS1209]QIZ98786.1 hypothetical protein HF024_09920 [Leifsonia sp. PS1209]
MSVIEWALLELLVSTDPAARLSALVMVATVLVAFALAAVVIASAARAVVRTASAATAVPGERRRVSPVGAAPPPAVRRAPLIGLPAPRAPGRAIGRPLRAL